MKEVFRYILIIFLLAVMFQNIPSDVLAQMEGIQEHEYDNIPGLILVLMFWIIILIIVVIKRKKRETIQLVGNITPNLNAESQPMQLNESIGNKNIVEELSKIKNTIRRIIDEKGSLIEDFKYVDTFEGGLFKTAYTIKLKTHLRT